MDVIKNRNYLQNDINMQLSALMQWQWTHDSNFFLEIGLCPVQEDV